MVDFEMYMCMKSNHVEGLYYASEMWSVLYWFVDYKQWNCIFFNFVRTYACTVAISFNYMHPDLHQELMMGEESIQHNTGYLQTILCGHVYI